MARNTTLTMPTAGFGTSFFTNLTDQIRRRMATNAVYRRTVTELSRMSDRELADIGISRGEIPAIAVEAARGA